MTSPTVPWPRGLGTLPREHYLTLLLLALMEQTGGELRLDAAMLEKVDLSRKLVADWDRDAQQLVLRSGSSSQLVFEVPQWPVRQPTAIQPSTTPTPTAPPQQRVVMDDEEVIRRIQARRVEEQMRQWRERGAEVMADLPQPSEPSATNSAAPASRTV